MSVRPRAKKAPLAAGDVVDDTWLVERIIGTGGMAVIAEASHRKHRHRVAIKMLLPEVAGEKLVARRFAREQRTLQKLHSEHAVRILSWGLHGELPFIVLELLRGSDLAELLKTRGPLAIDDAVQYVLQACHAVAEAHALGIVHRDLKPGNLYVTRRVDGSPCIKVLDFGISKLTDLAPPKSERTPLTGSQDLMGSPFYMAPEQLLTPREVDPRCDIWSLGVTLYQLLSKNLPFAADTPYGVCDRVLNDKPTPLRKLRPEVPEALEAAILRALRRWPSERYANVTDLARDLSPFAPAATRAIVDAIAELVPPTNVLDEATHVMSEPDDEADESSVEEARTMYLPSRGGAPDRTWMIWVATIASFAAGAAAGWLAHALR